jgi:AmiR/NasT family two-component response regulator
VITQKQLTDAMTTSTTIGRATGVVMQRIQLSADRAFELLTRVSRIKDLTLEVLADQILDEVTNTPAMSAPIASISVPSAVG